MSASVARTAALAQFALLTARVEALEPAQLELPARLEPWRVLELVAHVTRNIGAVAPAVARPEPAARTVELAGYYDVAARAAAAVKQRAIDDARSPVSWSAELATAVQAAAQALEGVPDTRLVTVRMGAVSLGDFLVTRCVEGAVHGIDLARALDAEPAAWVDPAAAVVCAQHLAQRGVRHGITAAVQDRVVLIGDTVIPILDYIEWSSGRGPAVAGFPPLRL
ncbi:maleylpyruvate isomerase N-terminal domain-containing protein [Winogradskya humida]|nr:maleylpyruvate isomerase N-terminal domain-containing protein [Actinoplanes humidus]